MIEVMKVLTACMPSTFNSKLFEVLEEHTVYMLQENLHVQTMPCYTEKANKTPINTSCLKQEAVANTFSKQLEEGSTSWYYSETDMCNSINMLSV